MEAYWPILISAVLVVVCGIITAFKEGPEKDFWVILAVFFTVMGAIWFPGREKGDALAIFLLGAVAFLFLFGIGLNLGEKLLSWRKAREIVQEMSEEGLSND